MDPSGPVDEAVCRASCFRVGELPWPGHRIVDLNEVTSIDKSGEDALSMMVHDGATFVASGVYTKHLLGQLQARQVNLKHLN